VLNRGGPGESFRPRIIPDHPDAATDAPRTQHGGYTDHYGRPRFRPTNTDQHGPAQCQHGASTVSTRTSTVPTRIQHGSPRTSTDQHGANTDHPGVDTDQHGPARCQYGPTRYRHGPARTSTDVDEKLYKRTKFTINFTSLSDFDRATWLSCRTPT
jgi:hypothetical protein